MDYKKVDFISNPDHYREKENLYLEVRRKEARVLDDDWVVELPEVSLSSPYVQEWRWRKRSFLRLQRHIQGKNKGPLRILDLGCGNGWMSNRLAENPGWDVTAVDLNQEELAQGARLFGRENLRFVYVDVAEKAAWDKALLGKFDVVVLAASVQYFPDIFLLVKNLRNLLTAKGTVHFIDAHFYPNEAEANAAKERTQAYYSKLGVPAMAAHYHHHLWPAVQDLGGENLNSRIWTKLLQKAGYLAPFPWIRLRQT